MRLKRLIGVQQLRLLMRVPFKNLWPIFLLIVFLAGAEVLADPDELSETEERALLARVSVEKCLTPQARQLVDELGLREHIDRLQQLCEHEKHKTGAPLTPEGTALRMEVTEVVLTTMLQCQEVIAQIDYEIADARELMAAMGSKRDKAILYNTYAALFANGIVASVGNLLEMPQTMNEQPGETLASGASLLSGGLGYLALRQQGGAKLSSMIKPNMLAKVFKRPNDSDTEYPHIIWKYLNAVPPGVQNGQTRRQLLMQHWVLNGRLNDLTSPKSREYMRVVSGTIPQVKTVTMNMLDDRSSMLADVRATVSQIYKELLNLMLVVRAL